MEEDKIKIHGDEEIIKVELKDEKGKIVEVKGGAK